MTRPQILILGGGQLARMLSEAAPAAGADVHVYAQSLTESAPLALKNKPTRGSTFSVGSLTDAEKLEPLLKKFPIVTFENEFISIPTFKKLEALTGARFSPDLDVLALTQDKLEQKKFFERFEIPTARYSVYEGAETLDGDLASWITTVLSWWGRSVLKWSRFGYDGKGNLFINKDSNFASIKKFYLEGLAKGARLYAEEMVAFEAEVALQVVGRRSEKQALTYPVVYSEQKNGICFKVWGPASSFGVPTHIGEAAASVAQTLFENLKLFGLFAIEGFITKDQHYLVNEIAPRVHNSGHYTLAASNVSQFENHLRAVADLPLRAVDTKPFFAMLNLIGPESTEACKALELARGDWMSNTEFYWYDKEVRPRRKVGHINLVAESKNGLLAKMKTWSDALKGLAFGHET